MALRVVSRDRDRQRLAAELRRLRERAGLSGRQLARQVGISQSKVSRIESTAALPTRPELTAWADATDAADETAATLHVLADKVYTDVRHWETVRLGSGDLQSDIKRLEQRARTKLVYEPSIVPGLLQVAEYARRLFVLFEHGYAPQDVPQAVASRVERQEALYDPTQRFEFVVTEAALRLRVAPVRVLLAQLDRIASVSSLSNVTLGVIPLSAPVTTYVPHGFVVFDELARPAHPATVVMVETVHANLTITHPADVTLYQRQWEHLRSKAAYGDAARDLLAEIATTLRELPQEQEP
jgi:transcriptional regulator with XRE-family HTH domain